MKQYSHTTAQAAIDDYAKDGGPVIGRWIQRSLFCSVLFALFRKSGILLYNFPVTFILIC